MIWFLWLYNWLILCSRVKSDPNPLLKGIMDAIQTEFNSPTSSRSSASPTKTQPSSTTKPTPSSTTTSSTSKETSKNPNSLSNIFETLFKTPKEEPKLIPAGTIKKNLSKDMTCEGCRDDQLCQTRCRLESDLIKDNPVLVKFCGDSCGPIPSCVKVCLVRDFINHPPTVANYQYALFRLDNCTINVGRKYTECAVNCKKSNNYSDCEVDCFNNIESYENQCLQTLSQLPMDRVVGSRKCALDKCTFKSNKDMTISEFYICFLECYDQLYYAMGWLSNHRGRNIDLEQLDKLYSSAQYLKLSKLTLATIALLTLYQLAF